MIMPTIKVSTDYIRNQIDISQSVLSHLHDKNSTENDIFIS